MMHLKCIMAHVAHGTCPKWPACKQQVQSWVLQAWKGQAKGQGINGLRPLDDRPLEFQRTLTYHQEGVNKKKHEEKAKKAAAKPAVSMQKNKKPKAATAGGRLYLCPTPGACAACHKDGWRDSSNFKRHMRAHHADHEDAPPPSYSFKPPPEERGGCLMCERGFPTAQALTRHRASPACGPSRLEEAKVLKLTGYPKVKLLLKAPGEDDPYTPSGVVSDDDIYLHSSHGINVLVDRHGMFAHPPTPQHAHEVVQLCSELHPCGEREDQFDIFE